MSSKWINVSSRRALRPLFFLPIPDLSSLQTDTRHASIRIYRNIIKFIYVELYRHFLLYQLTWITVFVQPSFLSSIPSFGVLRDHAFWKLTFDLEGRSGNSILPSPEEEAQVSMPSKDLQWNTSVLLITITRRKISNPVCTTLNSIVTAVENE